MYTLESVPREINLNKRRLTIAQSAALVMIQDKRVEKVVYFGSGAKGRGHLFSDIDVVAIVPIKRLYATDATEVERDMEMLLNANKIKVADLWWRGSRVHVSCMCPEDEKSMKRIQTHGILLQERVLETAQ